MSLYNTVNGMTPAVFFILPLLGKHPDTYPRFRDCFVNDEDRPEYNNHIHVYTRIGGGNRDYYQEEIETLTKHENYVADFDDAFDCTFASFVFSVPEKWKADFEKIVARELRGTSEEYKQLIISTFPNVSDRLKEVLY